MFPRLIPILQILDGELCKTLRFKPRRYVGDPVNAVRVFNLKGVDELVVMDIGATVTGQPDFVLIEKIGAQSFMPLAYGGGLNTLNQVDRLFDLGIDKVILGTAAVERPGLLEEIAGKYGNQSLIVSVEVKRSWLTARLQLAFRGGRSLLRGINPVAHARRMIDLGAGEILLHDIRRDGSYQGLDHDLIRDFAEALSVPLIACGGAKDWDDLETAIRSSGASAAASGSQFTFHGPYHAVLQSYPNRWGNS